MPASQVDRTLSAWKVDSGRIFLSSLRDAEAVAKRYVNRSPDLVDPPEKIREEAPLVRELDGEGEGGSSMPESACRVAGPSMSNNNRVRQAPSAVDYNQDANTVEIVKHGGEYEVVIDGVSQGRIEKEDGQYRKAYTFWMPRFKEKSMELGTTGSGKPQYKRVVQPVVFAMRVEDYEDTPAKCVVESVQRVVSNGQLLMDDSVIKTSELTPYQVNSTSANVTILPYPLVCTPEPYVTINDYSKALNRELALKIHHKGATFRDSLAAAYNGLTGRVPGDVNRRQALAGAARSLWDAAKILFGTGVQAAAAAASTGLPAGPVGAIGGAGVFLLFEYLRTLKGGEARMSRAEQESSRAMLAAALNRGPTIYKLTLPRLAQTLYRITETRANGSLVMNTDNTLGWTIHDFTNINWNAEAALLQWIMYGSGDRASRDTYTGLYNATSNATHVAQFANAATAVRAPPTLNTVGIQGMHPLTLANSRTEFSYTVRIQERDGTPGPVIVIDPTRINGLDAGWVAAGYEEQFVECRRAVDCLRSRLQRLPSVSRHMQTHGTFVSDTNNGVVVSDSLDEQARLLLGRKIDDAGGVATNKQELRDRLKRVTASMNKAAQKQQRTANYVSKLRAAVSSLKSQLSAEQSREVPNPAQVARAQERLRREENRANPNPQRIQEASDALDSLFRRTNDVSVATIKRRVRKREADLRTATEQQDTDDEEWYYMQQRKREASELASGGQRTFSAIFDYEASYNRLMEDVLGLKPTKYDATYNDDSDDDDDLGLDEGGDLVEETESEGELDDDARKDEFWQQGLYAEDITTMEEEMRSHFHRTAWALSFSLGATQDDSTDGVADDFNTRYFDTLSHRHARFVDILAPAEPKSNPNLMRFSAFLVPLPIKPERVDAKRVVRLLPQILVFSRELISTFGVLTILQPTTLGDKTLIREEDASLASMSIAQSRLALRNMTKEFPVLIREMSIYGSSSAHLYQSYTMTVASESEFLKPLQLELNPKALGLDFFAMSYWPPLPMVVDLANASKTGGSLLEDIKRVASGRQVEGVAHTLDSFGLTRDVYSYLALASFAEILSQNIVEQGYAPGSDSGFQLERIELVQSALSRSKYAAIAIGSFLSETYGSKTNGTRPLNVNDIAFYCIPGLSHLSVAMKRLGLFGQDNGAPSRLACVQMGRALMKLGSTQKLGLERLPFTCVQSSIVNIPIPVRVLNGNKSSVEIHLASSSLSYERVYILALLSADPDHKSAISLLCTDAICMRPIVLKAFKDSPLVSAAIATHATNYDAQLSWVPTTTTWSIQMLRARLARLRLDIFSEQKHEPAAVQASVEGYAHAVELLMVNEMNKLDVRDLSSRRNDNPVANYFIPFGFVDRGTMGDLMRSEFEQRPVWVERLIEAADSLLVVDAATAANARVVSSETTETGQTHNPHIIKLSRDRALRLRLYPTLKADSVLPSPTASSMLEKATSISKMCVALNHSLQAHLLSGKLCEHYRRIMHNAERLLQAVLAMAARVNTPDALQPVKIQVTADNLQEFHMPVLAAAACVANAMADVHVGAASRIVITETAATRKACRAIVAACKALLEKGIKAVPFGELCASLSLL